MDNSMIETHCVRKGDTLYFSFTSPGAGEGDNILIPLPPGLTVDEYKENKGDPN